MLNYQNTCDEEYQEATLPPTSNSRQMGELQIEPVRRSKKSKYFYLYSLILLLLVVIVILVGSFSTLLKSLTDSVKNVSDLKEKVNFVCKKPGVAGPCNCTQNRYHVSIEKANFFQAFINCKNAGMDLAATENENEHNAISAYLDPYKMEKSGNGFWLSGTNLNTPTSRQYTWLSTGRPVILSKWLATEPDNYLGKQHCLLWAQISNKIGWCDEDCEHLLRYVCEYRS